MSMPTLSQNPRRRVWRWIAALLLGALVLGSAWKPFMKYQAASELRAAGFYPGRADVWQVARQDWRGLFYRETWQVKREAVFPGSREGAQFRNLGELASA